MKPAKLDYNKTFNEHLEMIDSLVAQAEKERQNLWKDACSTISEDKVYTSITEFSDVRVHAIEISPAIHDCDQEYSLITKAVITTDTNMGQVTFPMKLVSEEDYETGFPDVRKGYVYSCKPLLLLEPNILEELVKLVEEIELDDCFWEETTTIVE